MAEVTLIVAPNAIAEIVGVAVVKVSSRYLYACDKELKTLFSCKRRAADDIGQEFIALVSVIAARALEETQGAIDAVDKANKNISRKV